MQARALLLPMVCAISLGVGCGDPIEAAADAAASCGTQTCPAGTAPRELREVSGSYDIGLGFNPASYSAEGAFQRAGSGSCEYACQVISPCPENTFPVITLTCFTCGVVNSSGEVAQGSCSNL